MDVLEQLCGQWCLVAGGAVASVPSELLDQQPAGVEVRGDDRASDVGRLLRFHPSGVTGLGLVELDVDEDTTVSGIWRTSPRGAFLADAGGGQGPSLGELFRPRPWLHDTTWVSVEADVLTLRDPDGRQTARLERNHGWRAPRAISPTPVRAAGLAADLVPVELEQLLGAWEPLTLPTGPGSGKRWQNLEFRDDGRWRAFPTVNLGGGPWRHEPDGTLFAFTGGGITRKASNAWLDLHPWLFPVAHAGLHGDELVLLDQTNHELQRLRRATTTSPDLPGT